MKRLTLGMAALLMLPGCGEKPADETPFIGKTNVKIENGRMTPEALWAMGRIGDVKPSPDAKSIAYTVAYYSVEQNKSHRVIYTMNADGSGPRQLTTSAKSEGDVCWIDNNRLAYTCGGQIWTMNVDGSNRQQMSDYDGDIEGFKLSLDGRKIMFTAQIKYGQRTADLHPDLPQASGKVINELMYKHWDEYVETIPHVFVADFDGKRIGKAIDILAGEPYESPMKPFGGMEQVSWSTDSKSIAYTCRKKEYKAYAESTDSDIYLYNTESGETINLCKQPGDPDQNMGYDQNPSFSPDGKYVAWSSMARDGYESDRTRLCVMDLSTRQKTYVTESFDSGVDEFCWSADSKTLFFAGVWHGTTMIYQTNLAGEVKKITDGQYDYCNISLFGNKLIAKRHSMKNADEIYAVGLNGETALLSHENDHIFSQLALGDVKERWIKTTDGKEMLAWVILPSNFDPTKKYPTLLFCEGGPQSPVSQFWSYRWNFQIMAANDYVIIAPNRRGLPGFGSEWLEEISGDYSGQCMRDLLSAIDDIKNEPYVDADHLGCVGASFGGYSVYWLAGHHDKRFKAFIAHDGIYNLEQQYVETEEMWFVNWDLGGAPWDKGNAVAQRSYANSPHHFIDKWNTPILCIHGEKDYRILASQAMSAFAAARLRGVDAQLLLFPDENHWVLKPQNGILWQRTFFAWLDKYLKH